MGQSQRPAPARKELPLAVVIAAVIFTAAASFFVFASYFESSERVDNRPINISASMKGDTVWTGKKLDGWGETDGMGTAILEPTARFLIKIPSTRKSNVLIRVTADTKSRAPQDVEIIANDVTIGQWKLKGTDRRLGLLPGEMLRDDRQLFITLKTSGSLSQTRVHKIDVLEANQIANVAGHVDRCGTTSVSGWAIISGEAAPVLVLKNGKAIKTRLRQVMRPDLPRAGYPEDAGFDALLEPAASVGDKLTVLFPNGRQLAGGTCTVAAPKS